MWLRDELVALPAANCAALQRVLVELGTQHATVVIPGYTHLQRAQPVYFAHHLLAYVEMLDRDYHRLGDAFRRANVCRWAAGAGRFLLAAGPGVRCRAPGLRGCRRPAEGHARTRWTR